jgi:CubicO group peptidase (beta-lactamase class C family)
VVKDDEIISPADAPGPVFSITKPMVANLVQQELALDERLAHWYPEFPYASEITVRHLLQHTSGMPNTFDSSTYVDATMHTPATARCGPGRPEQCGRPRAMS